MKENEKKTFSINMTYKALLSFIIKSYYSKLSGLVTTFLGAFGIVGTVLAINHKAEAKTIICYIAVAVICLVVNPAMLLLKAKNQLNQSPFYKKPITYEIDPGGLTIMQDEQKEFVAWKNVYKIAETKHMIAVYTSPYHAFVFPISELGDKKANIVISMVQFTEAYHTRLTSNLKGYRNGNSASKII